MFSLFIRVYLVVLLSIMLTFYLLDSATKTAYEDDIIYDAKQSADLLVQVINRETHLNRVSINEAIAFVESILPDRAEIKLTEGNFSLDDVSNRTAKVLAVKVTDEQDIVSLQIPVSETRALIINFNDSYSEEFIDNYNVWQSVAFGMVAVLVFAMTFWCYLYFKKVSSATRQLANGKYQLSLQKTGIKTLDMLIEDLIVLSQVLSKNREKQITFNSALHHETRIPLQRMRLALDIAQSTTDPLEIQQLLTDLDEDLNELSEITEDMLLLARLEYTDVSLPQSPTNLSQQLELLLEEFSTEKLTSKIAPDCIVSLHLNLFKRVVSNLLYNALKFAENLVEVRLYRENQRVFLCILDDGEGIQESKRQDVLQPFFQYSKQETGLGIGLPLVKHIMYYTKGEISILESAYGGAEVRLSWYQADE